MKILQRADVSQHVDMEKFFTGSALVAFSLLNHETRKVDQSSTNSQVHHNPDGLLPAVLKMR